MSRALGRASLLVVLTASAFCLSSFAGAGVLNNNPASYNFPTWTGSTPFNNGTLFGTVDYAVFAPGTFPYGAGGYTPTPNEMVYTYQVFVGNGSAPLSFFSVLLDDTADNIGNFQLEAGDSVPSNQTLTPFADADWEFNAGVPQNGMTYGLAFSSTQLPELSAGGTLDDGTAAIVVPLPSTSPNPIPEPASIGLLALTATSLLVRSRSLK